ncbi:MAG: rRNA maturation RNase YbeY [Bdellovibrionales bacterium]|nr:rRNA maturation RNase YbeY [Bdellovibrionales bacterium]
MKVHIIKRSGWRIPRQFSQDWLSSLNKELKRQSPWDLSASEITLVFVPRSEMQRLNRGYRGKNKVTDILSFSGAEDGELGELVLCGEVIEQQSKEHGLWPEEELGYLLIHGVLHLLGYEHEGSRQKAARMFKLQDRLFDVLRKAYFEVKP